MSLAELKKIAMPPTSPIGSGTPQDWQLIEGKLGTTLPQDYKGFVDAYGSGAFYDFLQVLTPFARSSPIKEHFKSLEHFRCQRAFPIFPDPGGLLLIGGDENGNTLFWHTNELPENWTIVYFTDDFLEFEEYDTSLTEFLIGWLAGEFHPHFLQPIEELRENGPLFRPYGPDQ